MKTHDNENAHSAQRRAVARQAEHGEAATQLAHAGADTFDHRVNHSPRMVAQRQLLGAAFGLALQQPVQRETGLDDEEPAVQGKQEVPTEANLTGMPNQLKSGVEALSGMDMSDVRVHRNSDKPAQLNALAYAQGNQIHLGPGQEQHLPHEAWHVVQQRQGRVQATIQMAGLGVEVNDDVGLEREAELMGRTAEDGLVQLKGDGKKQDLIPYFPYFPSYQIAQLERVSTKIGSETVHADRVAGDTLAFLTPGRRQKNAPVHLTKKVKRAGADLIAGGGLTHGALNVENADAPDYHFTLTSGFMASILVNSNIPKYLTKNGIANEVWTIGALTHDELAQNKLIANNIVSAFNSDLGIAEGNTFDNLMFTYDPAGQGPTFDEVLAFHDSVKTSFFTIPSVNPNGEFPFAGIKYENLRQQIVAGADSLAAQWANWAGTAAVRSDFRIPADKLSDLAKAVNILNRIRAKALKLDTDAAHPGALFDGAFVDGSIGGVHATARNAIKGSIAAHTLAKDAEF